MGEGGNGDFDHEWARIFTNGEGRGNGRDEGKGVRGACLRVGDFFGGMGGDEEGGLSGWR